MVPIEIAVKYFIPYLKGVLIHRLAEKGYTQFKVAKLMGLTQSMVNKYLQKDISYYYKRLDENGISRKEIDAIIGLLLPFLERGDIERYIVLASEVVNRILAEGKLCRIHRKYVPTLPPRCSICYRIYSGWTTDLYVEEFVEKTGKLLDHPKAYKLIPEVGMNIVYAPPDTVSEKDIIGYPGRIVKVGYRVVAVGKPIRGGSKHLASLLYRVRMYRPSASVAAAIRYDKQFINKLKEMGFPITYTGPHDNPNKLFDDLEKAIDRERGYVKVIADRGGYGLESIIYIILDSLDQLIDVLHKLLE
ncbi:MAG: hypothetical protein J7K21_02620 [Desulfurococcales archaeon]|nr:hypothetical protein [Desulfurococcales archaeon]